MPSTFLRSARWTILKRDRQSSPFYVIAKEILSCRQDVSETKILSCT
jgi:hypothetical protein